MSSQGESSTADPNDEVLRRLLSGFHNESILLDLSRPHLKPSVTSVYPVFVFQYALLVVTALCANLAALATVLGHSLYRDPTHCYVINLAIADLVKCLVVLPVSLAVLLVQNWIFGRFLCYFLPMLQVGAFSCTISTWK
ncbi:hypothetical protein AAG570_003229 [Ranatra chinensis]|uniref:G-protein coupled receptors family 1 profile domain-containing protein n=1 Tax=Ranatra chinensis TaxID=642074 RepID=A0ABD0Y7A5_9HEMI